MVTDIGVLFKVEVVMADPAGGGEKAPNTERASVASAEGVPIAQNQLGSSVTSLTVQRP